MTSDVITGAASGADGDLAVRGHFDAMTRAYLRSVISDELIEEHRRNPVGRHSEPLTRLLIYFAGRPIDQQYALKKDGDGTYRILKLGAGRATPPEDLGDAGYGTYAEARHGIFLRKLKDLMEQ